MKARKSDKSQIRGAPWRFVLRFVTTFIIVYLLWHFSAPVANKAFTFFGGNIVMLFDRAGHSKIIEPVDEYVVIKYGLPEDLKTLTLEYKGFTFNTAFLLALIMAVPNVNYKLRLKILILGLVILYPIQVFRLVVYIFNYYCHNLQRKSGATIYPTFLHHAIGYADRVLIRIDGQIIPVFIWACLFYYYKWHNVLTKMRKKTRLISRAE